MNIESLDLIEQALDATLRELHGLQEKKKLTRSLRAQLNYWTEDECEDISEQTAILCDIVDAPLKLALRRQLNWIGVLLFQEVRSTEAMKEVAEWVASLDVGNYEFRIDALDNAFVGVGEGDDVWTH